LQETISVNPVVSLLAWGLTNKNNKPTGQIKNLSIMALRIVFAIMGCTSKMFNQIVELAIRVYETLFANPLIYPNPPLTDVQLKALNDAAVEAVAMAEGGGTQARLERDVKIKALYSALVNQLLPYVNGSWRGNALNLGLSGFPLSKEPSPVGAPEAAVIKRIVKGIEPGTVKVILEKRSGTEQQKKAAVTYYVFVSDDEAGTNLRLVHTTSSSHDLIVRGIEFGQLLFYAVSIRHRKIGTQLSAKVKFLMH
jgi:hypothetical protein